MNYFSKPLAGLRRFEREAELDRLSEAIEYWLGHSPEEGFDPSDAMPDAPGYNRLVTMPGFFRSSRPQRNNSLPNRTRVRAFR